MDVPNRFRNSTCYFLLFITINFYEFKAYFNSQMKNCRKILFLKMRFLFKKEKVEKIRGKMKQKDSKKYEDQDLECNLNILTI